MKVEIIRQVIFETMEEMRVNPYGLTFYNTKRGVSVAFISAFGESVKDCFKYDDELSVLSSKATELCSKFRHIDMPFA